MGRFLSSNNASGTPVLKFSDLLDKPTTRSGFGLTDALGNSGDQTLNGNLTATGNITAYSDERLKKDWIELPVNIIEKIAEIKSGLYTRIDTGDNQIGVSAQDLKKILPDAVFTDEKGILSVNYGNAALVLVIQLAKEIQILKKEIDTLRNNI